MKIVLMLLLISPMVFGGQGGTGNDPESTQSTDPCAYLLATESGSDGTDQTNPEKLYFECRAELDAQTEGQGGTGN